MQDEFSQQELEQAPLSQLIDLEERRLVESRVLTRASTSGLYRTRWQLARVNPEKIKKIEDLRQVPLITEHDLVEASRDKRINSLACSEVQCWFRITSRERVSLWIPYGQQDIALSWELALRMSRVVGFADDDILLIMNHPAPSLSNALPYFLAYAHKLKGGAAVEIIPMSLPLLELRPNWADFFLRRQPTVLMAPPGDALRLAEILRESNKKIADSTHDDLSLGLGQMATAGVKAKGEPKRVLEKLRLALLYDDSLEPYRQRIREEYAVDTCQTYGIADFSLFNVECQAHQGIHIWLDVCIPEIIPSAELDWERSDSSHSPRTVFLTEAEPGLTGELVITTFGQAFPLVRYRTAEQVEVISTEQCQCGRTHPRVRLL